MNDKFIRIGDKLININKLIHVAPTKELKFWICTFDSSDTAVWLDKSEFEELSCKLNSVKQKVNK